jgi:hypothetical protein
MMHKDLLLIPMRKCTFHLATFVLRSTCTNRHNSSQGYNLDELINQSEPICGLASCKGIRVIGKLASTTVVSFRPEIAIFGQRGAMVPKSIRICLLR